jgi:hypothetical protein
MMWRNSVYVPGEHTIDEIYLPRKSISSTKMWMVNWQLLAFAGDGAENAGIAPFINNLPASSGCKRCGVKINAADFLPCAKPPGTAARTHHLVRRCRLAGGDILTELSAAQLSVLVYFKTTTPYRNS